MHRFLRTSGPPGRDTVGTPSAEEISTQGEAGETRDLWDFFGDSRSSLDLERGLNNTSQVLKCCDVLRLKILTRTLAAI